MRFRLTIALTISLFLIIFAGWMRVHPKSPPQGLVAVKNADLAPSPEFSTTTDSNSLENISTASTSEPLSDTDLIGRQLFSDYLDLTMQGQATPENVDALAGIYAQSITSLTNNAPRITSLDISIVPNSQASIQAYGDSLTNIYVKYEALLKDAFSSGQSLNTVGTALTAFGVNISKIYTNEVNELKKLSVPAKVSENHVSLINTYLSSASAYKALANADENPAEAVAAITIGEKNADQELVILKNLENTLRQSGIISRNQ